MYKILIVEDDRIIADKIKEYLNSWGYDAHIARDLTNVTAEFADLMPQLVLMDILLPACNGYHWCQEIRKMSKVPVIFLSSAADNMNIVMAVNMGGDDFIAKPFDLNVLLAKIQAILRRTYDFGGQTALIEHKGAVLNVDNSTLVYQGEQIELSKNEFCILRVLMEQKGKTVKRDMLMERLWKTDSFVDDNTLTVNVTRLRRKLEQAGLCDFITTRKGIGYLVD